MRSRWLDIGQVIFLHFYGPRLRLGPYKHKKRMRPISSHLDRTSLVNKGFTCIMAKRLHQVSPLMHRRMFPLVVFKINRSKLIFVHLTLLDACNNQCFINVSFCKGNELCKPVSSNLFFHWTKAGNPERARCRIHFILLPDNLKYTIMYISL